MSIWWPSPEAIRDELKANFEPDGLSFTLSAAEGTECSDWLNYYNQTDELRQTFAAEFLQTLDNYASFIIHGQTKKPDDPETGAGQEEIPSRERAIHETLCDI